MIYYIQRYVRLIFFFCLDLNSQVDGVDHPSPTSYNSNSNSNIHFKKYLKVIIMYLVLNIDYRYCIIIVPMRLQRTRRS